METIAGFYIVDKSDIGFIKFIFEAYEGIAVVSTLKTEKDTIAVYTAPGCEDEVDELIDQLCETIKIREKT